jgi:hypothetical protein
MAAEFCKGAHICGLLEHTGLGIKWHTFVAHPHIGIGGEIQKPFFFDKIHMESGIPNKQSRRPTMSMKPQPIPEIPAETVRVVRAVFPKGNIYIHLRDTLGTIYQDGLFEDLYPDRGQAAYARLSSSSGHGLPIHGESDGSAGGSIGNTA